MIHQNSLRFYEDIAYDTYNGLVLDDSEGKKLAGDEAFRACDSLVTVMT